jgi:hypothetical protein
MMFPPVDGGTKLKTEIAMMRRISQGARYIKDPGHALAFGQIIQTLREDRARVFEGTDDVDR